MVRRGEHPDLPKMTVTVPVGTFTEEDREQDGCGDAHDCMCREELGCEKEFGVDNGHDACSFESLGCLAAVVDTDHGHY